MKQVFVHLLWPVSLVFILSACATKQPDYLKATTIPPVVPPENVDKERLGQLYRVPEKTTRDPKKFTTPFPPTVGSANDSNIASIQTFNEQLWVLNAKPPATTWSQLVSFWQQKNVVLARRDLNAATLDTGWFEQAVQPGFAARYRLRLEQGLQADTTEIYMINEKRALADQSSNLYQWPDQLEDRTHANWLAQQLVASLNSASSSVGDSYLAATINLPDKVQFTESDQEPVLIMQADDGRVNRALINALDENGLLIYDSDTAKGVFYFDTYKVKKKKKSSWINFVNFSGSQEEKKKSRYSLEEILERLPNDPETTALFPNSINNQDVKKLSNISGYLLVKRKRQNEAVIYVRDGYGKLLDVEEARVLLDTIRLRLI